MKTIKALTASLNAARNEGHYLAETKIANIIDDLIELHDTPALFTATLCIDGGHHWTETAITANQLLDAVDESCCGGNGAFVHVHFTVEAR